MQHGLIFEANLQVMQNNHHIKDNVLTLGQDFPSNLTGDILTEKQITHVFSKACQQGYRMQLNIKLQTFFSEPARLNHRII